MQGERSGVDPRRGELVDGQADPARDGASLASAGLRVRFGDVVVLSDGTLGVVAEPVGEAGLVTCLELDELGNLARCGRDPGILMAPLESVHRVVGCRAELGEEIRRAIQRFRDETAGSEEASPAD